MSYSSMKPSSNSTIMKIFDGYVRFRISEHLLSHSTQSTISKRWDIQLIWRLQCNTLSATITDTTLCTKTNCTDVSYSRPWTAQQIPARSPGLFIPVLYYAIPWEFEQQSVAAENTDKPDRNTTKIVFTDAETQFQMAFYCHRCQSATVAA